MSTRATYEFNNEDVKTTMYIHHDGYQEGAASYFYNALCYENKRGAIATYFLRANHGAEIVRSHDQHGDTEFRYDIDGNGFSAEITCLKYLWDGDYWRSVFKGSILEFIERYSANINNYSPFKLVKADYSEQYHNTETITAVIDNALSHLKAWGHLSSDFKGGANWQSTLRTLEICLGAFPQLDYRTEEIKPFIVEA